MEYGKIDFKNNAFVEIFNVVKAGRTPIPDAFGCVCL